MNAAATQGKSRKQLDFAAAKADDVVLAPSQQPSHQPLRQPTTLRRSDSTQTDPWLPPAATAATTAAATAPAAAASRKRPTAQTKHAVEFRVSDGDDDDLIVTSAPGKAVRAAPVHSKRASLRKRVVVADNDSDDEDGADAPAPAAAATTAAASGRASKAAVATSTLAKRAAAVVETGAPVANKLAPRASKQPQAAAAVKNLLADVVGGGGGGGGGGGDGGDGDDKPVAKRAARKDDAAVATTAGQANDPFRTPDAHMTGAAANDESPQGQRVRGGAVDDVAGKQPAVVNTVARPRAVRAAANGDDDDDDRLVKKQHNATTTTTTAAAGLGSQAFPSSSEATRAGKWRPAKVRRLDLGEDDDDDHGAVAAADRRAPASFAHEDDAMDVVFERSDDVRWLSRSHVVLWARAYIWQKVD